MVLSRVKKREAVRILLGCDANQTAVQGLMDRSSTILKCPDCGCAVTCRQSKGEACVVTFECAEFRDLCCVEGNYESLHCPTLMAMIETLTAAR